MTPGFHGDDGGVAGSSEWRIIGDRIHSFSLRMMLLQLLLLLLVLLLLLLLLLLLVLLLVLLLLVVVVNRTLVS